MRDPDMMPAAQVGLVLLAAGGSKRLGSPKQLVTDAAGRSLVRRAAETALASACRPVVVVLGASAEAVEPELGGLPVTVTVNPNWQTGLASSLKAGVNALTESYTLDAVVVMLCDQPQVTSALLDFLVTAYADTGHAIAACEYGGALGVPALFGRTLFGALASLTGDEGARQVIKNYAGPVARVPFPEGALDIDTPQEAKSFSAS